MLFPPPGVKIRRTLETFFLPNVPTLLVGRDPRRVLVIICLDLFNGSSVIVAGNREGLVTPVYLGNGYAAEYHFLGPEEVWAQSVAPSGPNGSNVLVQSVFYD